MSDGRRSAAETRNGIDSVKRIALKAYTTLRMESKSLREKCSFTIVSGLAELAGAPLRRNVDYPLDPRLPTVVFTWKGCVVEVAGWGVEAAESDYCPFGLVLKNHALLEADRHRADETGARGPRVLVVGEYDSGKTTVVRSLLNYAVRVGRTPLFVSLDVRHGELGVPGSLGALVVDKPIDHTGRFCAVTEQPLMYHFGHAYISDYIELYTPLVETLGQTALEALDRNPSVRSSGFVIDTNGSSEGLKLVPKIAEVFQVSHVIVMENERLYNDVVRDVPPFVNVSFLPKLPGVVKRSRYMCGEDADNKVAHYFGNLDAKGEPLSKSRGSKITVPFDEVKVYEAACDRRRRRRSPTHLVSSVRMSEDMTRRLLAVSSESKRDEAPLANIHGYVAVTRVDRNKKELHLKLPGDAPLPGKCLLLADGCYRGGGRDD